MSNNSSLNPVDFRGRLCGSILGTLAKGDSCSVIGVGSSGKSNVAKHLVRRDVRDRALGVGGARMLGVYVDFQDFSATSPQALQQALLEALRRTSVSADAAPALNLLRAELTQIWEAATGVESALRVFAYLRDAVELVLARGDADRVFFILDDFDKVVMTAEPAALNSLRKLRDEFKTRLAYVVVTWKELHFSRPNTAEYKDFFELVSRPVYPVGPYESADSQRMIDRLARQSAAGMTPRAWAPAERERMIQLSGGHAGLLRLIYAAAERATATILAVDAAERLVQRGDVSLECATIWDSLDAVEGAALTGLPGGAKPGDAIASRLRQKGLILSDGASIRFFSPVFEAFVRLKHPADRAQTRATMASSRPPPAVVSLDPKRGVITIDQRPIPDLDPVGYALLEQLARAGGRPVTPRELLETTLKFPSKTGKFRGTPETRRDRTLENLMLAVNLPGRAYIMADADGSHTFA